MLVDQKPRVFGSKCVFSSLPARGRGAVLSKGSLCGCSVWIWAGAVTALTAVRNLG